MSKREELEQRRQRLTPAQQARLAARLRGTAAPAQDDRIPRRAASGPQPLSFSQERLWLLEQLGQADGAYVLVRAVRLDGPLNRAALTESLYAIVRRHAVLRTLFPDQGGWPVQQVQPPSPPDVPLLDWTDIAPTAQPARLHRFAFQEIPQAFNLARELPFRLWLVRLAADAHVLVLQIHHIAFDGWSVGVWLDELATHYAALAAGAPAALPPLPIQYADYACWQREQATSTMDAALRYWQRRLAGLTMPDLPADHPRPAVQTHVGAYQSLHLPPARVDRLKTCARTHDATLFMMLLAAFKVVLYRQTGSVDVVVGSPIAGRARPETEPMLGCFINTLVLRTDLGGSPTFGAVLARVRKITVEAYLHQEVPFERLLEVLKPPRDLSRTPLFQVFFNMQNFGRQRREAAGLVLERLRLASPHAPFDLTLYVHEQEEGLSLQAFYNTALFEPARMAALLDQYGALLDAVAEAPDRPIDHYDLATPATQGDAERLEPAPTLAATAQHLTAPPPAEGVDEATDAERYLIPMCTGGSRPLLFLVHNLNSSVSRYAPLSRHLSPDQPLYGVQGEGLDGRAISFTSVEAMAQAYTAAIRTVQPTGPYHLAGYGMGSRTALEIAHQLQAAGQEVALLLFIEARSPSLSRRHRRPEPAGVRWRRIGAEGLAGVRLRLVNRIQHRLAQVYLSRGRRVPQRLQRAYVMATNRRLLRAYQPPNAYPGQITLIRREGAQASLQPPDLGWGAYTDQPVVSRTVPGSHRLLEEPHVHAVAHVVQACMDAAVAAYDDR